MTDNHELVTGTLDLDNVDKMIALWLLRKDECHGHDNETREVE
jgi:hypothetical protein